MKKAITILLVWTSLNCSTYDRFKVIDYKDGSREVILSNGPVCYSLKQCGGTPDKEVTYFPGKKLAKQGIDSIVKEKMLQHLKGRSSFKNKPSGTLTQKDL